jgi:hypothetical protein
MPVGGIEYVSPLRQGVSSIQESREERVGPSADTVDTPKAAVEISISPEAKARAQEAAEHAPQTSRSMEADLGLTQALGSMDLEQQEARDLVEAVEPQTRTTDPEVIATAALGA